MMASMKSFGGVRFGDQGTTCYYAEKQNNNKNNNARIIGVKGWRRRGTLCVRMKANNMEDSASAVNGKKLVNGINHNNYHHIPPLIATRSGYQEYLLGGFVENRFVYRQCFVIRSYEIGPDKTVTMETLMNLLQETALNHVGRSGVAGNGFGATLEMSIRKLIWVVTRIHVQVEKYSSWGDVVEIDTWVGAAGKNGMRRDWIIRDYNTQQIITRATSTWVTMDRETRRLSKIPDEVKKELEPFYIDRAAIAPADSDRDKIEKLTDETSHIIRPGLAPRWSDMDANQHVNNVKYIGWLLESVPINVLEDYNMKRLTLEYRRECRQSNVLVSLTGIKQGNTTKDSKSYVECTHLLRMENDEAEIVRARSVWQSKPA